MSARPVLLLAALAVLLSGCIAAPVYRDASFVTPKDPPRLPQRKPPPPANFAAWTAPIETAAAPSAEASVTVEPLAPLNAAAAPPAPHQPATVQAATLSAPPSAPAAPSRYRVAKGDSLYGIARRFGLPVRAVIDANALEPPYRLNLGQELTIPQAQVHEVAKGDTIFNIARRYDVDRSELVRLNGIEAPYTIPLGQKLILPQPASRAEATAIASAPQVRAAGQGGQAPATAQAAPAPAQSQVAAAPKPPLAKPPIAKSKPPPVAKAAVTTPGVLRKPPARAQSTFLWPVRGPVLSSFGRKTSGVHNDGINIVAPRGTPVRAAENGVVAYAGEELKGFGRLLLIKHADGWITAYAHNEKLLVARGDVVKRGQTIARVGSSGSVDRPQLHFEVRRGTRAVNPETMMGPRPNTAAKAN